MITDSSDSLTYEALMAAIADIRAAFRPLRVIADFPLIATDHAGLIEAENILVIGRAAWRELLKRLEHSTQAPGMRETLFGVEVEMFDLARADHRDIARALLPMIKMPYDPDDPRYDLVPWHKSYIPRPLSISAT